MSASGTNEVPRTLRGETARLRWWRRLYWKLMFLCFALAAVFAGLAPGLSGEVLNNPFLWISTLFLIGVVVHVFLVVKVISEEGLLEEGLLHAWREKVRTPRNLFYAARGYLQRLRAEEQTGLRGAEDFLHHILINGYSFESWFTESLGERSLMAFLQAAPTRQDVEFRLPLMTGADGLALVLGQGLFGRTFDGKLGFTEKAWALVDAAHPMPAEFDIPLPPEPPKRTWWRGRRKGSEEGQTNFGTAAG